jgi:hypothetical protein
VRSTRQARARVTSARRFAGPTEWISIRDTEFLLSVSDDDSELEYDEWSDGDWEAFEAELGSLEDDDMFEEIEGWGDEDDLEWADESDEPFPRYQILVTLVKDEDVP